MTIDEAAAIAGKHRNTVTRWAKIGWVKAEQHPVSRTWVIDKQSLQDLLKLGPPHRRKKANAVK